MFGQTVFTSLLFYNKSEAEYLPSEQNLIVKHETLCLDSLQTENRENSYNPPTELSDAFSREEVSFSLLSFIWNIQISFVLIEPCLAGPSAEIGMIQRSFNYSPAVSAVSVVSADCGSVVSVTANVTNCRPWRLYLLAVFYGIDTTDVTRTSQYSSWRGQDDLAHHRSYCVSVVRRQEYREKLFSRLCPDTPGHAWHRVYQIKSNWREERALSDCVELQSSQGRH